MTPQRFSSTKMTTTTNELMMTSSVKVMRVAMKSVFMKGSVMQMKR